MILFSELYDCNLLEVFSVIKHHPSNWVIIVIVEHDLQKKIEMCAFIKIKKYCTEKSRLKTIYRVGNRDLSV